MTDNKDIKEFSFNVNNDKARIGALRDELSTEVHLPVDDILLVRVTSDCTFEILIDMMYVSKLEDTDTILAYNIDPKLVLIALYSFRDRKCSKYPLIFGLDPLMPLQSMKQNIWDRLKDLNILDNVDKLSNDDVINNLPLSITSKECSLPLSSYKQCGYKACPYGYRCEGCDLRDAKSFANSSVLAEYFRTLSKPQFGFRDEDVNYIKIDWSDSNFRNLTEHLDANFAQLDVQLCHAVSKLSGCDGSREDCLNLDACFRKFTNTEVLDEDNKWYCNKCKEHVKATKTMQIWKVPDILVLHLKRFEYSTVRFLSLHSAARSKVETVSRPLLYLQMSPYDNSWYLSSLFLVC